MEAPMNNSIDDGGPAFPMPPHMGVLGHLISGANGMSLRDWFAGQALAGMHGSLVNSSEWPDANAANFMAKKAYESADAMIAERKRGGVS